MRIIRRSVSPRFIELCMERPCCCLSQGHKWRPYNNRNICHWVSLLKQSIITLELWHVEINSHSSARTVQLAKNKPSRTAIVMSRNVKDRKFKLQTLQNEELCELKHFKMSSFFKGSLIPKTKANFLLWNMTTSHENQQYPLHYIVLSKCLPKHSILSRMTFLCTLIPIKKFLSSTVSNN